MYPLGVDIDHFTSAIPTLSLYLSHPYLPLPSIPPSHSHSHPPHSPRLPLPSHPHSIPNLITHRIQREGLAQHARQVYARCM